MKIVGLPSIEDQQTLNKSEKTAEGMRRASEGRRRRYRNYLKRRKRWEETTGKSWTEQRFPGEVGKYKHTRNEMKRRYRDHMRRYTYKEYGLIQPTKGTGVGVKRFLDYAIMQNFISHGWNPSTGAVDPDQPEILRGRWDLEEEEWLELWRGWNDPDLRSQYCIKRLDSHLNFTVKNLTISPR